MALACPPALTAFHSHQGNPGIRLTNRALDLADNQSSINFKLYMHNMEWSFFKNKLFKNQLGGACITFKLLRKPIRFMSKSACVKLNKQYLNRDGKLVYESCAGNIISALVQFSDTANRGVIAILPS